MKYLAVVAAACLVGSACARPDGAGGHHHASHEFSAPSAPSTGYQEPTGNSGYAAPNEYEQPGYDTGYGNSVYASDYGVAEEGGFDISMLLIPILIIAGLALLFPATVNVGVRKRRSAEDEVSGNSIVSRIQDIYSSVVQSEECMERVACEVGGIASDTGVSKDLLSAAEPFVSRKYSKLMKRFQVGKDCHKIKCGNLF